MNVSGSVCDACAWEWLCTAAVAVVATAVEVAAAAAAAVDDEDEDEACARCFRHGTSDRSSMISSSPSSTTHHPPAERQVSASVSCIGPISKESTFIRTRVVTNRLLKVTRSC